MSLVERMNVDGGDRNEEGRESPEPREGTARRGNVDGGGG